LVKRSPPLRPSPADLEAARNRTIPDVLPPPGERLLALITEHRPRTLAIAGVTAYRSAFGHPHATIGPQPAPLGGSRVWVLPNPSGLNALWTTPRITEAFGELRVAICDI
jgi:double-stranded uracil-DNA glycosylase